MVRKMTAEEKNILVEIIHGRDIPSLEISIGQDILSAVEEQFLKSAKEWRFNGEFFRKARENKEMPTIVPILDMLAYCYCEIANEDKLERVLLQQSKTLSEEAKPFLKARIYQFLTGHLREIDVMLKLYKIWPDIQIKKNIKKDLKEDTDFIIERNGTKVSVAVRHPGKTSDHYNNLRKGAKSSGATTLIADDDKINELHTVSIKQTKEKLGGILDNAVSKTKCEIVK